MTRTGNPAATVVAAMTVLGLSTCALLPGSSTLPGGGTGPVSPAVVADVPLSDYGTDVAVRRDGERIYVPVRTGRVLAVDAASRQVASTIVTDGQPYALALTPDGTRGYVMDMAAQYVFVVDTVADRLLGKIAVGIIARPILTPAVAVSRDGTRAYVTNATVADDHILVIDIATNTIVGDHFLKIHPVGVAVSPDGRLVYVAGCKLSCIDGTLLTLDAASGSVVSTLPLTSAPSALVLAPDGSRAYMPNGKAATVALVELATGAVETIAVGPQPTGIAVDPRGTLVYVTSFGANNVSVIDPRTAGVVATIPVARGPRAIAVDPAGRFAYVTHSSPRCSVIDLRLVALGAGT